MHITHVERSQTRHTIRIRNYWEDGQPAGIIRQDIPKGATIRREVDYGTGHKMIVIEWTDHGNGLVE